MFHSKETWRTSTDIIDLSVNTQMGWYVYILQCSDNSLYTGITNNLKRRIIEHNSGKGAKSILGKRPVKVVYTEKADNQIDAARRERQIKGWNRKRKLLLVNK